MTDFKGFPQRPNLQGYTAIPNTFFDDVLSEINNMSELKVLLAVFRKTYGWVKEIDTNGQPIYKLEDEISYSQFEGLTGLSSTSVASGITRAIDSGFLEKTKQGNYSGATNAYRIVTSEDDIKPSKKKATPAKKEEKAPQATPVPETPKSVHPIQRFRMDDNIQVDTHGTYGTPMNELTGETPTQSAPGLSNEKQGILDDIFGSPAPKETKPKKKEKESTPHQRFTGTWLNKYREIIGMDYGGMGGKEHGQIKNLCAEYDIDTLVKAVEYYFRNYKDIEGLPEDYPTLAVFIGWRKTLIPQSKFGKVPKKQSKKNEREFVEDKWKDDDFFD